MRKYVDSRRRVKTLVGSEGGLLNVIIRKNELDLWIQGGKCVSEVLKPGGASIHFAHRKNGDLVCYLCNTEKEPYYVNLIQPEGKSCLVSYNTDLGKELIAGDPPMV